VSSFSVIHTFMTEDERPPHTDKPTASRWVFTLNNWTAEDVVALRQPPSEAAVRYFVCSDEVGSKTRTPHLQGFMVFTNSVRMSGVRVVFPPLGRAWMAPAKGTTQQASSYCKKSPLSFTIEHGVLPGALEDVAVRRHTQWDKNLEIAKKGRFDEMDAEFQWRFPAQAKRIHQEEVERLLPKIVTLDYSEDNPPHLWIHGPARSGKSMYVDRVHPDHFPKNKDSVKWTGYDKRGPVYFADMGPGDVSWGERLKVITDRYPFNVEMNYMGEQKIRPSMIIVTSQYTINQLWSDPEIRAALNPRFRQVGLKEYQLPVPYMGGGAAADAAAPDDPTQASAEGAP